MGLKASFSTFFQKQFYVSSCSSVGPTTQLTLFVKLLEKIENILGSLVVEIMDLILQS